MTDAKDDAKSDQVTAELENIDDECDQKVWNYNYENMSSFFEKYLGKQGIVFVKISNPEEAKEYGIDEVPSLIYFENGIPSIYEGKCKISKNISHFG